jgi:NifB/MoaA-like Fe-S oxidoreductase
VTYVHGATLANPRANKLTSDQVRERLERLRVIRAQLDAELEAKEAELARIRAARQRLQPVATYKPTPQALAYREMCGDIIAAQPAPLHGGSRGLAAAAREATEHEARKRDAENNAA